MEKSKPFRLSHQRLHLTYKTHLDAKKWLEWADKNSYLPKIEYYSIVNESADEENPYEHTHILIGFEKKLDTRIARIFDYMDIHPHIKKISKGIDHWNNTVRYHYKENKPHTNIGCNHPKALFDENGKPSIKNLNNMDLNMLKSDEEIEEERKKELLKASRNWTNEDTFNCESISEALLKNNNPKMAGGIIGAFSYKPANYGPEPKVFWRIWQNELFNELKGKVNLRSVIWYFDFVGSGGKSVFAQHLMKWHGAVLSMGADTRDLPTALMKHKMKGGKFNIIIIDLSRTTHENDDFYDSIEQIKNGQVMCPKYNSTILDLGCIPHVVVLSNRMPRKFYEVKIIKEDINEHNVTILTKVKEMRQTFSSDRWDIRTLDKVIIDGRRNWKVTKREFTEIEEDELPEGYVIPGSGGSVAEPDEIIDDPAKYNEEISEKFLDKDSDNEYEETDEISIIEFNNYYSARCRGGSTRRKKLN